MGQPKVNKVKIFLLYLKFMKRPKTKSHSDTMNDSKVIKSKNQNLSLGQTSLQQGFFLSIFY